MLGFLSSTASFRKTVKYTKFVFFSKFVVILDSIESSSLPLRRFKISFQPIIYLSSGIHYHQTPWLIAAAIRDTLLMSHRTPSDIFRWPAHQRKMQFLSRVPRAYCSPWNIVSQRLHRYLARVPRGYWSLTVEMRPFKMKRTHCCFDLGHKLLTVTVQHISSPRPRRPLLISTCTTGATLYYNLFSSFPILFFVST